MIRDAVIIELLCAEFVQPVVEIDSNAAYLGPWGTEPADCTQRFVGNIQQLVQANTRLVIYFLLRISAVISMHRLSQPVCGLCRVYGDDMNLSLHRFTPDMGNATLLMATRLHPGKPSRVEWETGSRSCWTSSRMSIFPSGERQVSLKTICLLKAVPIVQREILLLWFQRCIKVIFSHGNLSTTPIPKSWNVV